MGAPTCWRSRNAGGEEPDGLLGRDEGQAAVHHQHRLLALWAIFSDADMAGAMLDRVIHHGRLVTYDRESYRMRNSLMRADAATS